MYVVACAGELSLPLFSLYHFSRAFNDKILVQLLEELFELLKVSPRYWGKDKIFFPTIALLELVSTDYPERYFDTGIS